jgi:hypothetical protein
MKHLVPTLALLLLVPSVALARHAPTFGGSGQLTDVLTSGTFEYETAFGYGYLDARGSKFEFGAVAGVGGGWYKPCDPCSPGSYVDLILFWIDNDDTLVDWIDRRTGRLGNSDANPTLVATGGTVRLPDLLSPQAQLTAPFNFTLTESPADAVPFPGMVVIGTGTATATFIGDAEGWHLLRIVYRFSPMR